MLALFLFLFSIHPPPQLAGMILAPVALLLILYALFVYRSRSAQIARRETVRFDDQKGPVVLTIVLVAVLLVSYILTTTGDN